MKKPKLIPAYRNSLTYNERRYDLHLHLAGLFCGAHLTWGFGILSPYFFDVRFSLFSWQFIGYCIIISLALLEIAQYSKYKKLIKLEPKIKQTKPDDTSSKEFGSQ